LGGRGRAKICQKVSRTSTSEVQSEKGRKRERMGYPSGSRLKNNGTDARVIVGKEYYLARQEGIRGWDHLGVPKCRVGERSRAGEAVTMARIAMKQNPLSEEAGRPSRNQSWKGRHCCSTQSQDKRDGARHRLRAGPRKKPKSFHSIHGRART